MTYTPDFSGIWAKIDRAKTHRDVLEREIDTAFGSESNRIGLSVEYDEESGYHIFRAHTFPDDLLRRWGILIGDTVHNLRGALDHLVWQLSLYGRNGRNPRNRKTVQFPILKEPIPDIEPEAFLGAKKEALWDVVPRHRAIIEGHQPYKGWHGLMVHPLARLRELSNTDKHRIINPVLALTDTFVIYNSTFEDTGGEIVVASFRTNSGPLELGAEVTRVLVAPPDLQRDVKVAGNLTPLVCFPDVKDDRQYTVPVSYALDRIAGSVAHIVRKFEPLP